ARLSPLDHHPCLSILSDFDRPCTCILHIVERRQRAARSRILHVPFLVRAGTDTQNSLFMLRMHDDLRATWSIRTGQVLSAGADRKRGVRKPNATSAKG